MIVWGGYGNIGLDTSVTHFDPTASWYGEWYSPEVIGADIAGRQSSRKIGRQGRLVVQRLRASIQVFFASWGPL
jgi:hypothetical protein